MAHSQSGGGGTLPTRCRRLRITAGPGALAPEGPPEAQTLGTSDCGPRSAHLLPPKERDAF